MYFVLQPCNRVNIQVRGDRNSPHVPSSPPGMEKSWGRTDHFCIFWALEMARPFARSMPACSAFSIFSSRWFKMSDRVVAELPMERHHATAAGLSFSVGSIVSMSTTVWKWTTVLLYLVSTVWKRMTASLHRMATVWKWKTVSLHLVPVWKWTTDLQHLVASRRWLITQ